MDGGGSIPKLAPALSFQTDGWFVDATRLYLVLTKFIRNIVKLTAMSLPQSLTTSALNFGKVVLTGWESASGVCVSPKWPLTA